ncbi:MAG: PDZ domain-containing protein [Chitinophagaceae bacterium]|nr:PDZ domain-containing protein [Chitinophagaceae bacterium]
MMLIKLITPVRLMLMKYIYGVIEKLMIRANWLFTKTREAQQAGNQVLVWYGHNARLHFRGTGVRAVGISEGKPAEKAGLKTGDIILQIGDYKIPDVQGYMQTLGKFKKGDATKVTVKRGAEKLFLI